MEAETKIAPYYPNWESTVDLTVAFSRSTAWTINQWTSLCRLATPREDSQITEESGFFRARLNRRAYPWKTGDSLNPEGMARCTAARAMTRRAADAVKVALDLDSYAPGHVMQAKNTLLNMQGDELKGLVHDAVSLIRVSTLGIIGAGDIVLVASPRTADALKKTPLFGLPVIAENSRRVVASKADGVSNSAVFPDGIAIVAARKRFIENEGEPMNSFIVGFFKEEMTVEQKVISADHPADEEYPIQRRIVEDYAYYAPNKSLGVLIQGL